MNRACRGKCYHTECVRTTTYILCIAWNMKALFTILSFGSRLITVHTKYALWALASRAFSCYVVHVWLWLIIAPSDESNVHKSRIDRLLYIIFIIWSISIMALSTYLMPSIIRGIAVHWLQMHSQRYTFGAFGII